MEICIDSVESARNAIEGGANRLEVCSALSEGGLTPSFGFLKKIKRLSTVPIYAMLRARSGNFVYTIDEMEIMLEDLKIFKNLGVDGFVFGALTSENQIHVEFCKEVLSVALPLPVTFHRAFDEVDDPLESLKILIDLGFVRVLTSGQKDTAEDGLELIKELVREADGRITVMPGSGITKENILKIKSASGAKEFHASAKKKMATTDGGNRVKIGTSRETCITMTDKKLVEEMVEIVRNEV
ncbi:Copper homeostasis protein cutC like protein [Habropoda laboriosa]|uniref:Copper homeostasis protein cutC homolog n=1 Tax=Habropoda laboriosa TaxID=597456 RepID=A0A0L7QYP5_9HYME|nr:PREDICTED: copper homeostasis protein cutC homolog [Habropoda laboriosa]KOC63686.1 Copper homeostasis protein cutC like protein [Habropoda laboriosa]